MFIVMWWIPWQRTRTTHRFEDEGYRRYGSDVGGTSGVLILVGDGAGSEKRGWILIELTPSMISIVHRSPSKKDGLIARLHYRGGTRTRDAERACSG
ncbi:hypothetical protein Y032_0089g2218 [Ancylostoma ceylanicum]|uniref:Uncharacterized protein n=1 Tax=Ancylostoma ceylanicum TaxID=53326 RepID=A0A016TMZ5_9BILA|nr:hypothetical protein Y032_0089g2218 [Ancylostoma ceylanicum]